MTNPEESRSALMLRTLLELVAADDDIIPLFDLGEPLGAGVRRIRRDDPTRISKVEGRSIAMTQVGERQTDASFDNPSDSMRGSDEHRVSIAVTIYVYKDKYSDGEDEKELVVNLTGAVREAILKHQVGPAFTWFDIVHRGSEYDSTDSFRRSDSLYVLRARARKV